MTQDASPRLHVVTGNHIVMNNSVTNDVVTGDPVVGPPSPAMADLLRRAAEFDARVAAEAAPRTLTWLLVPIGTALTVVFALLGRQAWPLPGRDGGSLTGVPQSLVVFLLLCTALCLWTAGRSVQPARTLTSAGAVQLWWALVAGAALVAVAADLSLASYADTAQRPADLLVRCLVPLVPAVLAGFLAADAGRAARVRAALGTGLVTVPLTALGWALLSSSAQSGADLGDVLAMTGLAALAPLVLGVLFVAADRRGRAAR